MSVVDRSSQQPYEMPNRILLIQMYYPSMEESLLIVQYAYAGKQNFVVEAEKLCRYQVMGKIRGQMVSMGEILLMIILLP